MEEKLRIANGAMEVSTETGCFDQYLGLRAVSVSEEGTPKMCFAFEAGKDKMNRYGALHGALISGIMDEAMGMAATAFSGMEVATVSCSLNYNRGGLGENYVIEVIMEHVGRRMVSTCARLYDTDNDKLCATALGTYAVSKNPAGV